MTTMPTMYGIFKIFSRTNTALMLNLDIEHQEQKVYQVSTGLMASLIDPLSSDQEVVGLIPSRVIPKTSKHVANCSPA